MKYAYSFALFGALLGCAQSLPLDHKIVAETLTLKSEPKQAVWINPKDRVIGESRSFKIVKMSSITVNDKLRIQVEVLNDRGRRDIVYYRVRWLDEVGSMIGQYDPWQTESFEGGQTSILNFESPYAKAVDFRLELKPQY